MNDVMTADQAALQMIADAEQNAKLNDKSRYGVHRHAECEAWANFEQAGGEKGDGRIWGQVAWLIADHFHAPHARHSFERSGIPH